MVVRNTDLRDAFNVVQPAVGQRRLIDDSSLSSSDPQHQCTLAKLTVARQQVVAAKCREYIIVARRVPYNWLPIMLLQAENVGTNSRWSYSVGGQRTHFRLRASET